MNSTKLIAIPFAGGNKYSYERFLHFLPPNMTLHSVEFPGRGDRLDEENLSDIRALALDVLEQIKQDVQNCEYIIYGHSMGALVGYELVKEILKRKYRTPSVLFFTGRAAPSVPEELRRSTYPKELFWHEVSKYGGIPDEILSSGELLDFF